MQRIFPVFLVYTQSNHVLEYWAGMRKNVPREMILGGMSTMVWILTFLPRNFVLGLYWSMSTALTRKRESGRS